MTIPDYQKLMLPLLAFSGDEKEHSVREVIEYLSKLFNLTDQEKNELLPSGQQNIIDNRVGWAKTYLLKAGLLESTKRSFFIISKAGIEVLKTKPQEINNNFLRQYPAFVEFRTRREHTTISIEEKVELDQTPQELLEIGYQKLNSDLIQELLKTIHQCSPKFFERLVVDLLREFN